MEKKTPKSHSWNDIYNYHNTAFTKFNDFDFIVGTLKNCFPKQNVKITYTNRCKWTDQNINKYIYIYIYIYIARRLYTTEETLKRMEFKK